MNQNGKPVGVPMPIPLLGQKQPQQPPLTHFLVTVEEPDGRVVERDYLITDLSVDAVGNLHLIMNGRIVASLSAGFWIEINRADFAPTDERILEDA